MLVSTDWLKEHLSASNLIILDTHPKPMFFYGHGHSASSLFLQLKIARFDKVKLYDGSFVEWYGKRLPLE